MSRTADEEAGAKEQMNKRPRDERYYEIVVVALGVLCTLSYIFVHLTGRSHRRPTENLARAWLLNQGSIVGGARKLKS